ncbi:MAG TPA: peroxiredoxin [Methyloceanibacter sp.]|nr:peroxiredoxin [Methyloceanibacter sp.]
MPGSPRATNEEDAFRLAPDTKVPPVTLPATDGTAVDLAALEGRSVVVVYPWTGRSGFPNPPDWDRIPGAHGSTPELEGFRDRHADFVRADFRLVGLSRQDTAYQRELVARLGLPFPIVSDAWGAFGTALALPTFATGGTVYLKRLTLVIVDGRIERVFYPVIDPAGHAAEVLREVETGRAR